MTRRSKAEPGCDIRGNANCFFLHQLDWQRARAITFRVGAAMWWAASQDGGRRQRIGVANGHAALPRCCDVRVHWTRRRRRRQLAAATRPSQRKCCADKPGGANEWRATNTRQSVRTCWNSS